MEGHTRRGTGHDTPEICLEEVAEQLLESIEVQTPSVMSVSAFQVRRHPLRHVRGEPETHQARNRLLARGEPGGERTDGPQHLPGVSRWRSGGRRGVHDPHLPETSSMAGRIA